MKLTRMRTKHEERQTGSLTEHTDQTSDPYGVLGDSLELLACEMRNSIMVIRGSSSLVRLRDDEIAPEQRRASLESIERHALGLMSSIDEILDIARSRSWKLSFDMEAVDFTGVLTMAIIQARADNPEYRFSTDFGDLTVKVLADKRSISRVFANLLANAASHAPAGTEIQMRARPHNGGLIVTIVDHEPGSDTHRFGMVPVREEEGNLGLRFCRLVIDAHGGRLKATRDRHGTSIVALLPSAE